jgi:hypothetical protein
MPKNIFVVGADEFNCNQLKRSRNARQYEFHTLLTFDEVKGNGKYPSFDELIQRAEDQLDRFDGNIDGIIGYWDFPVNAMVPILCERYGLPSLSTEAEMKCDHKYWSRREQAKVIPEHTPSFAPFNPFDDDALRKIEMPFPFWIKPVKGTDSLLAYVIHDEEEFNQAIETIRDNIGYIGKSFNQLMAHANLSDEIAAIDGYHCIAEEMIHGHQCTVEGHVYNGEPFAHGVVDSINYPNSSSFFRYQYPSLLSDDVKQRMMDTSLKLIKHLGFETGGYNIEYFYDKEKDDYQLLEINPRISQSHSDLFYKVDGESNHELMVELALGHEPNFPYREGEYGCAAKFHLRRFEDGYVTRVPTPEEIEKAKQLIPGSDIEVKVRDNMYLHDLIEQDSYSFDMAHIFIGASDEDELLDKYHRFVNVLPFEFSDKAP